MAEETAGLKRNLSRVELAFVVVFISILVALAITKILSLGVKAEQTGVNITINTLRTDLRYFAVHRILDGKIQRLDEMGGINPFTSFREPPLNYHGEVSSANLGDIEPGTWYFNVDNSVVGYRVEHADQLISTVPGPKRIRFRVELDYQDLDFNGRYDPGSESVTGLVLALVEGFSWK